MEEVDKIIIHSLKEIGCDIDEETQTLQHFTPELVIEAALRCLRVIQDVNGDLILPDVSTNLPSNMSSRFRIGTSVAKACTDLGYTGEVGYQTFLYPTESELRKVFIFLLERLPKESDKGSAQTDDDVKSLREAISESVRLKLLAPWMRRRAVGIGSSVPFVSCPLETGISLPGQKRDCTPQEWREYCVGQLPFIHEQVAVNPLLVPSLINENCKGLVQSHPPTHQLCNLQTPSSSDSWIGFGVTPSRLSPNVPHQTLFALTEQFKRKHERVAYIKRITQSRSDAPTECEELHDSMDIQQKIEEKKEKDMKTIERLKEMITDLQAANKSTTSRTAQVEKKAEETQELVDTKLKEIEIQEKTLSLLSDSDVNMAKMQALVEASVAKLDSLSEQWEKHKAPLIAKCEETRQRLASRNSESVKQHELAAELRDKLREISEQLSTKEALQTRLQEEIENLPKDVVTRPAYTRRIMEIIGSIRKQCQLIDNVVCDTKQLQKDINMETGRLERSFTVANELIFKDAKRDEMARSAYKLLALLHSDCGELVEMVEETGIILREMRDLEEQIEVELAKNTAANLERITADLKQMHQESDVASTPLGKPNL